MARKKKKRKQRSEQPAATPAVPPIEPHAVAEPQVAATGHAATETPLDAVAVRGSTPGAHGAHEDPADTVSIVGDEEEPVVANLDDDLDGELEDERGSYDSLVAAVAGMDDDPPSVMRPGNGQPHDPEMGAVEVVEVHDLDDDMEAASIDRLIAQVDRAAPSEKVKVEPEEDLPVIDLDDDVPVQPARRGRAPDAAKSDADVSRLARAAAAGAVDDTEPRAIPLDLFGDVSTPEARARLLAEALAHAEHKEARYRVPLADTRRVARWKSAAAAVVLVLAGVVAVAPPAWVRPEPPARLSEAARAHGIRLALLLQAQQVEAFRVRTQELPASLDDLPMSLPGLRYARSGRSYQLVGFTPRGDAIVYDAADPSPAFRALQAALTPQGHVP